MMSGANDDLVEGHERGLSEEEVDDVAAGEEHRSSRSRSRRSQALDESDHPSSHHPSSHHPSSHHPSSHHPSSHHSRSRHSGSRSTRSRNDSAGQGRRHRTRGEEESPVVEILERTNIPYGRELPPQEGAIQAYGPPPIHGPQHMYAPPGVYGPQPRKRSTRDLSRLQDPSAKPPRHPKMRSYDDGGFMSLVKAIGINLVEEQLKRKNESQSPRGKNGRRPEQPRPQSRNEERRGRSRRSRSGPNRSPLSRHGERSGSERPETPRPGTPAGSDGHHEPPLDPAIEAEYRQAEEMEAERAQEARGMEEGNPASLHDPEEHNPVRGENPFHDGHEAAGPMDSSVSSMPPSSVRGPESHPPGHASAAPLPGSRHSSHPPSVAGSTHRHPPAVSPAPRRRPEVPEQTDSEGTDDVHSGNESDHSNTSTRATVPSSNLRSTPPSSRPSPTSAVRGRSGRQGGRGGRTPATRPRGGGADDDDDDELGDKLYDLHESYDDEYEGPQRSRWDANYRPSLNTEDATQGRRMPGHRQEQPRLVKLPYSDFWVAAEHYEYYSKNPPPREHAPRPSTTRQARHGDRRSGRHDDSNAGARGHKKSGNKKPATEKQKKAHSRHGKYDPDSEGPSRRHGRRRTASSPARAQKPKDKEKSKSSNKARPTHSTRRRHESESETSSSSSSESDTDSYRTEKPTKESQSTVPRGQQPRERSRRPYNRTESRRTKRQSRYSDSLSSDSSSDDDDDDSAPYSKARYDGSKREGRSRRPPSYSPPRTPRAVPERPKDYYAVLGLSFGATAAEYVFFSLCPPPVPPTY